MDERTGEIRALAELHRRMSAGTEAERLQAIEQSENYVEIPAAELPAVQAMNRHDLRAWAAQKRRQQKAVRKKKAVRP